MSKCLPFLFCLCYVTTFAQSPVIDGVFTQSEWQQASKIDIPQSPTETTSVYLIHDGVNFYFAFTGHLESNGLFPEVLIDVNNDRSTSWQPDDWWFHISAADCESQGAYGSFGNCQAVQPDWIGIPNLAPGPPNTDTVELKIPFSKINLQPNQGDTIGIAFVLTNATSQWLTYPASADQNNPSTWVPLVFQGSIGFAIPEERPVEVRVSEEVIDVVAPDGSGEIIINIFDLNGRSLSSATGEGAVQVQMGDYHTGIYILHVESDGQILTRKFVR